ncbi:hypothetical protein ASD06_06875 [Angustibacter sp. Root456]|nr:hypothetical protein ASD06_06875 [Angustibacter sp. Root456]
MKKNMPIIPATSVMRPTKAAERVTSRNSAGGVIGACARRSSRTNPTSSTAAATNDPRVTTWLQPRSAALTKP